MVEIVCPTCQKMFLPTKARQKYCCRACTIRMTKILYMERHREKIYARNRAHRAAHPEKVRAQKRESARKYAPKTKAYRATKRLSFPLYGILSTIRYRCKKDNMPYSLSREWAEARWTGHCELSGLPFDLGLSKRGLLSPSVDRIDPAQGYVANNCRIILWALNTFKNDGTDEQMYRFAEALLKHRPVAVEGIMALPA